MQSIIDAIEQWLKDFLIGAITGNLSSMFSDVNSKVATIATEVGKTPESWNSSVFSIILTLSKNVVVPIAGLVIAAVLTYELISMIIEKNNMHDIWQRTTVNRYAGKTTRIYLDEFHLLLKEPQTAAYTAEIYKRFRKWNGIPTALTQNVKDLLESPEIENILENSDFILMLNQAASDRNILAQRLGISPQELGHITNSDAGEGLLFFGDKIIPFVDKFPTDTKLYQVMTTKPADLAA